MNHEPPIQSISTRERIIAEATRLFNRDGWRQVTVRDISRSLEISPGNLSYHFPKKEDLIKVILSDLWKQEKEQYLLVLEDDRGIGQFLEVIRKVFRHQLDHHGTLSIQYLFYEDLLEEDGMRIDDSKKRIFRKIIEYLVKEDELSGGGEDVTFLISFLLMFSRSWIMDHSLDGEADIQHYLYLLAQQFYYFATEKGMRSIDSFLEKL